MDPEDAFGFHSQMHGSTITAIFIIDTPHIWPWVNKPMDHIQFCSFSSAIVLRISLSYWTFHRAHVSSGTEKLESAPWVRELINKISVILVGRSEYVDVREWSDGHDDVIQKSRFVYLLDNWGNDRLGGEIFPTTFLDFLEYAIIDQPLGYDQCAFEHWIQSDLPFNCTCSLRLELNLCKRLVSCRYISPWDYCLP